MKIRYFLLPLVLLLLGQSSDALRTKVENAYKKINSLEAKVVQTNYFAQLKTSKSFEGKIFYQVNRLLLRFEKPYLQRLQISGSVVDIYDSQSQTLISSALMPELGQMNPLTILQFYWNKSKVEITAKTKGRISIKLTPKNDTFVKTLSAVIDAESALIYELSYADFSNNTVSYVFSGIKTNHRIDPAIWKFNPPKGTQLIHQ